MFVSVREGENIQPVLPRIQGSLTSVSRAMLGLKRFLLTQRKNSWKSPCMWGKCLCSPSTVQFTLWSSFERSRTGGKKASVCSVLVLICLLPYISYQGLLCSPQWARHGMFKSLSCLFLALAPDQGTFIWNCFCSVGTIIDTLLWVIFTHNRFIVGTGISP